MKILCFMLGLGACFFAEISFATVDASLQMQLGNPSGAITDTNNHDHYLIQRSVETIDYSDNLREPNWASWDLTSSDEGTNSASFITDTNLPANFYRVVASSGYTGSGYDRGHMCPDADRSDTLADNKLVYFMSNIIPQQPDNNEGVWAQLESTCRSIADAGNELLITCGPSGFGTNRTASNAQVFIPSNVWKIIVVVPLGSGSALSRITATNRVIAVNTPNIAGVRSTPWSNFVTSVNVIQTNTGYTFFTALPSNLATVLRAKVDGSPLPAVTNITPLSGATGSSVTIYGTNFTGASTVWFNGTNASFNVVSGNQITAIVPGGATTGPISVIAPGGLATSAANFSVTTPIAPSFQSISAVGGQIFLTITGAPASSYTIAVATNLAHPQWITLLTTNPAVVPFMVVDTNQLPQRFYRVQNP